MGAYMSRYRRGMAPQGVNIVTNCTADTLLTTTEAAARIGVAEVTVRMWRWRDDPHQPPYVRVGARGVKYRADALDQWIASRTHQPGTKPTNNDRSPSRQRGRPGPR
jgi:predicted DNA-binding transcriptional regulator AlpA